MIARLKGLIDSIDLDRLIVDVNGVGYLVLCSGRTLRHAGNVGEAITLHIETHVREDALILYGFLETQERDWFRFLTTVQGVGPKVGLSLLTALSCDQLTHAITSQDAKALCQADGVGPKLANRIVSELKDKVMSVALSSISSASPSQKGGGLQSFTESSGPGPEAVSALVNLGYKKAEALSAVSSAFSRLGSDVTVSSLIREGLRELSN